MHRITGALKIHSMRKFICSTAGIRWRHGMNLLSAPLARCSPVGGSPSQRDNNAEFWCFICCCLNKSLKTVDLPMVDISCDVVMRSQNISCGERYIPHGNKYSLWKFDQIILSRKWSTVEMIYSFQKWIILCPNKSFFVEKCNKFPPSMSLQVFYIILWRYRSLSVSWKKIIFHRKEIVEKIFLFRVKYSS